MEYAKDQAHQMLIDALVPSPPPPSLKAEDLPSLQDFLGSIVYFLSFFTSFTDFFESDEIPLVYTCGDYEYKQAPFYLVLGNGFGCLAFFLAYAQMKVFQLSHYGHYAIMACVFFMFSRHLGRVADLPRKRVSFISAIGTLPLICLCVLHAETVSVRNCKMFYVLQIVFSTLPLPALFREWRSAMHDQAQAKARKRLFLLFFILVVFIGSSSPRRTCSNTQQEPSDFNMGLCLAFDLGLLYIASDSLWV